LNFDVTNTADEFGANPVEVNVSRDQAKAEHVKDEIFHVGQPDKARYLLSLLQKHKPKQSIIFSNYKHNVERIAKFLNQNGYPAMGISSLISQSQRTRIMELFRTENNDRNLLVATDVAARGLDIKGVDMVINFELPDDAENYVHRIGRTGRAGAEGQAFSLVSERDVEALQRIESYLGHKVEIGWIEDESLVKDYKEFPRDEGRRDFRRPEGSGAPRGGHGGPRPHGGGGRPVGRGGDRPQHGGSGGRRFEKRPHERSVHGDQSPRHGDQQGPRHGQGHGRPHEKRPRHDHPSRDRAPGQGQHQHAQGQQRPHHHKGPRPHGQQQGPRHGQQRPHQHTNRQGYKHKPQSQPVAAKSVVAKVTGFFKKLFQ
jgi:ATP-dependent RNA helicase RhlB